MDYTINSTKEYHTGQLNTLGWELTVCNALYPAQTPLREILSRNDSFGHLLYDYLSNFMPMENIKKIMEIGGGYGYLMKDFLGRDNSLQPCMIDISPFLLQKQKETLCRYNVSYREEDFMETDPSILTGFDLAILNENLGDFPTLTNLNQVMFQSSAEMNYPAASSGVSKARQKHVMNHPAVSCGATISKQASGYETRGAITDPTLLTAFSLFEKYDFEWPEGEGFNLNIGAIQALEKLCASGIPYIYLGEHSCEAGVPEALRSIVHIKSTGNPEKISLMGHNEYSIRFSHLQQVAHTFNYTSIRGPFADFLFFDVTEELRFIMASQGRFSDEGEMICQFVEDLYKYEYLILIKNI
ncbi:MAG: SAM-dependent methyltransferase [Proteobacteria bacterium]|nr:SAM-dependent methyltransferase [Pseudomonadota bacterium]